ncbi:hypothetical protein IWX78_000494 [Mycetocola sp. CAN_C7]
MAPHISTGDVVSASDLPDSSPVPIGGVVTFTVDDRTVVHRVVTVEEDNSVITAGDANPAHDPWSITREDITGQARLLVPYVGLPGLWLQRSELLPLVLWLGVTAGAIALALPSMRHREKRESDAPTDAGADRSSPAIRSAVGAAALVGLLALTIAVPRPPVDAAFTGGTRTPASWSAKSYQAITVGGLSQYGALAATSVRDTNFLFNQSSIDGFVGTTPGTNVSGFNSRDVDAIHLNDQSAKAAMTAARALRTALMERPVTRTLTAALGGTLTGGVYTSTSGAFAVGGTLTLDAQGDSSARFVFRTTTTFTMAQRARVILANGAQAANVHWIVGTTATLGTLTTTSPDTTAVGNLLVSGEVSLRGVKLSGRAVSFDGGIALNGQITPPN